VSGQYLHTLIYVLYTNIDQKLVNEWKKKPYLKLRPVTKMLTQIDCISPFLRQWHFSVWHGSLLIRNSRQLVVNWANGEIADERIFFFMYVVWHMSV